MHDLVPLQAVDYLVMGHITQDLTPAGPRLGGTATYSALTARALGLRVGIVTSASEETSLQALAGIPVISIPSEGTTTFENIYASRGGRIQILHHQAAHIPFDLVPEIWRSTPIIHLGPVAQELDQELPGNLSPALLGLTPQGWMRRWDEHGHLTSGKWENAERILPEAGAVVISREDIAGDEELIEAMAHQTAVLAVTEAEAGAVLYWNGDRRRFRAPEVEEADATGAGDIFASAFFVRLCSTRDPWEAARFATQLAARSVARVGLDGIPTPREIEECSLEVL
ncbi:MAG TPA: PfkB family carbohydrate kinase [Anaerolineales bacterium]|nr:PfkB family carbohydrate kinase [Anaerolineales bacterium]